MSLHPDFIHELQRLTSGDIRTDDVTRTLYSTDASIYQIAPRGVFIPQNQDDLQAAVELAAKYKIPILPRGSGSSLAGQAIGDALILDLSRHLDKIVDVDPEARTATVEPGVILSDLNRAAANFGLGFGPDPASADRATMGGVIANNATGAHSIRYGMAADHILSADVILADGSLSNFAEISMDAASHIGKDIHPTKPFELGKLDVPANLEATLYSAALHIRSQFDEQIRRSWPRVWRNTSGYRLNYLLPWSPSRPPQWDEKSYPNLQPSTFNFAPLLAGSEGTLAVIRKMTVKLVPWPKHTVLVVIPFDSVADACDATPAILEKRPSAVELLPRILIDLAREVPAYAPLVDFVGLKTSDLLVIEFAGNDPVRLQEEAKSLGNNLRIVTDAEAQARIWKVRKVGLGILSTSTSERRGVTFIEDCAVPVESLGEYVRGMDAIFENFNTTGDYYAHASAGCLHMRPVLNVKSAQGRQELRAIAEAALALVLSLGGAMTGEHGDGLSRSEFLEQIYGQEINDAFRLLKNAADPDHLLNPGKIVSPPPMDENLRYGPEYDAKAFTFPVLDYGAQGGLIGAIEQCNGAGVCLKFDGTMCPTFQATREESHSTRGRANMLRAFISGKNITTKTLRTQRKAFLNFWRFGGSSSKVSGQPSSIEDAVAQSLDLCIACKGCKSECPSGVDMAKLRYEFFNHYYQSHAHKLRDYVFGYIGTLAKLGAPFGKILNWGMGNQAIGSWAKKVLGVATERALPKFNALSSRGEQYLATLAPAETSTGERSLKQWGRLLRKRTLADTDKPAIVLYLPDPFTRYFESEIERAALSILRAAGCHVIMLPILGAGRTLISKSFLDAAKKHAQAVRDAIAKIDPEGIYPVVGVEPSEIYTLKDEYLDFFPNDKDMQALDKRSYLIEEFLLREKRILRVANKIRENAPRKLQKISLHGHCYQKARPPADDGLPVGQEASAALLRAFGYEVEIIPSGCCGMAGSFGYEEEHYALSMQVGELILFPEIRQKMAADGPTSIVAPGTSCREQIADGTGVVAEHPLVLISAIIDPS